MLPTMVLIIPGFNITSSRSCGIDQSVTEAFPVISYAAVKIVRTSKSPLDCCALCLSEFVDDNILRLKPGCRLVFHTDCINTWLENHVTCPVCQSNLSDPEVRAGKCLLPMNSELEELDICSQMSEHELKSDNGPRVHDMIRAKSIAEGCKRFTLSLPEKEFEEIEAAEEHRRSTSVQDYTFPGKASWRNRKLRTFLKSSSCNGRNHEGESISRVAEEIEASASVAASRRQLDEPSIHSETSESELTLIEFDLTDLPVHE